MRMHASVILLCGWEVLEGGSGNVDLGREASQRIIASCLPFAQSKEVLKKLTLPLLPFTV